VTAQTLLPLPTLTPPVCWATSSFPPPTSPRPLAGPVRVSSAAATTLRSSTTCLAPWVAPPSPAATLLTSPASWATTCTQWLPAPTSSPTSCRSSEGSGGAPGRAGSEVGCAALAVPGQPEVRSCGVVGEVEHVKFDRYATHAAAHFKWI